VELEPHRAVQQSAAVGHVQPRFEHQPQSKRRQQQRSEASSLIAVGEGQLMKTAAARMERAGIVVVR
jgi:hypothetical protein